MSLFAALFLAGAVIAASLEEEIGRSEVRVFSGRYRVVPGRTVAEIDLSGRLEQLGYNRVHEKPGNPGEYFWGQSRFWIYQRAVRYGGRDHRARLIGLDLDRNNGMILGPVVNSAAEPLSGRRAKIHLEPLLLSESLAGDRAARRPIEIDALPEHIWRPVLAAEDARFFEHAGVDGRSLARALLANVKAGKVSQGGSTITQQLIKNRDLTPKRTLGRKASEAVRALALEAAHDKKDILQAYLNQVYLGHVGGLAVHGFGAASRTYFSKPAEKLTLGEASLLAAMVQGPNRLNPLRHPETAKKRRDWVLGRMAELGWASEVQVKAAQASAVRTSVRLPEGPPAPHFLASVSSHVRERLPDRMENGRGMIVETTLDPLLQEIAEEVVRKHLQSLRGDHPRLRDAGLTAALVALDADNGAILAYVGGDPSSRGDRFDRAGGARRQPGSIVKPLLLLEAFESCGDKDPLHPATRIIDAPIRIDLPTGAWEPRNYDGKFRGTVDIRTALRYSLNVPFVRSTRWCGEEATAARMRRTGLSLPGDLPLSFSLGAVETSPLELAGAYTVFATPGKALRPYGINRIERPSGRRLANPESPHSRRVVRPSTAYIVRDLMRDAVSNGTGRRAEIEGIDIAGKTGTSSSHRDAWFAGHAGNIVVTVWIGLDREDRLGLSGGKAAAPLFRRFMLEAVPACPPRSLTRPRNVVEALVDPKTGNLVSGQLRSGRKELFRRGAMPRHRRIWRRDSPEQIIH